MYGIRCALPCRIGVALLGDIGGNMVAAAVWRGTGASDRTRRCGQVATHAVPLSLSSKA